MKTLRFSLLAMLAFFCTTLISCNDDAGGDMDADIVDPDLDDDFVDDDDTAPLQFTKFMYKSGTSWKTAEIDTVNHEILMAGVENGLDISDVTYTLASSSIKIAPEPSARIGGWQEEEIFEIYRGADIIAYTAKLTEWVSNDVDHIGFESFSYKVGDTWYEVAAEDLLSDVIEIPGVESYNDITDVSYSLAPASATIYPTPETYNSNWSAETVFKVSLLESSAETTIKLTNFKYSGSLSDQAKAVESALTTLQAYMTSGTGTVTDVENASTVITAYGSAIAEDNYILELAFNTIDVYEETYGGALFVNSASSAANSTMLRTATGLNIHFAQAALQQAIIDNVYTSENLVKYADLLTNKVFNTSAYFPGALAVKSEADSTWAHTRTVEIANRVSWGSPFSCETSQVRRPTGCYAAPGSVITVTVPEELVGLGISINVGSHTWDNSVKPTMKRLDRITVNYPITSTETLVCNPLGGNIMIHVPYDFYLGVFDIQITNAYRAPYFTEDKYNQESWEIEKDLPGLWAVWESDKMMIEMPAKWCNNLTHAEVSNTMTEWDLAITAINEMRGWEENYMARHGEDPADRDRTTLYLQCDLQMRGSAYFPGYPQTNDVYNPNTTETGRKDHYYINGPEDVYAAAIHELGHGLSITKFAGETEAFVNFPYVAMVNRQFNGRYESEGHGYEGKWDLDKSYDLSFTYGTGINATIDGYATSWMIKDNFRAGNPMNNSNVPGDEVKYQHRGWGKYVDFVNLFGWDALDYAFYWYEYDYMYNRDLFPSNVNSADVDHRILKFSMGAECDVTPLIHFWGVQPVDYATLESNIATNLTNNNVSNATITAGRDRIYDRLMYYKEVAPKNNAEFNTFQAQYCSSAKEDASTATNGDGWYRIWKTEWNETHYQEVCDQIDNIISIYFLNSADPNPETSWSNENGADPTKYNTRHESAGDYTCTNASPWKRQ